jgi:hypothetical protein
MNCTAWKKEEIDEVLICHKLSAQGESTNIASLIQGQN